METCCQLATNHAATPNAIATLRPYYCIRIDKSLQFLYGLSIGDTASASQCVPGAYKYGSPVLHAVPCVLMPMVCECFNFFSG